MSFLQLSLIMPFSSPVLFVCRFTQVCLFCRSPGLDWGSDTDLFLTGSGVWCANCLFQLQQIQQQLLQVKSHRERQEEIYSGRLGAASTHAHTRKQHKQVNYNNLWRSLKPTVSLTPCCATDNHNTNQNCLTLWSLNLLLLPFLMFNWHMTQWGFLLQLFFVRHWHLVCSLL